MTNQEEKRRLSLDRISKEMSNRFHLHQDLCYRPAAKFLKNGYSEKFIMETLAEFSATHLTLAEVYRIFGGCLKNRLMKTTDFSTKQIVVDSKMRMEV